MTIDGYAKVDPGDLLNIAQSVDTLRAAIVSVLNEAKTKDTMMVLHKLDEQCPSMQQAIKGIMASLDKIADDNSLTLTEK